MTNQLLFISIPSLVIIGLLLRLISQKNKIIGGLQEKQEHLLTEKVQAVTQLESLTQQNISSEKQLELLKDQLENSFSNLASKALEGNTQHFLTLARTTLDRETQATKGELDKKQVAIENLLKPLTKSLDNYQNQAQYLEVERQKAYLSIDAELKRLIESNSKLSLETKALKNALKKPHVRGRWGEVQLKNCIELAGMSEFADVTFQDFLNTDDKQLIPDMTVKMPGGRVVVVDAKTPLDAFLTALESNDEEVKASELLRHGRHLKEHVKKLSAKNYAGSIANSADFTVMFLPNESFLYAALETQKDIVEFALEKKILIATPPTLIGLLKVIRYGWNEEKLAENAQKISEAGIELHNRICDFVRAYENVGRFLEKAQAEYEVGKSRLESRVIVQARRLEKLGAKSNKELPSLVSHPQEDAPTEEPSL